MRCGGGFRCDLSDLGTLGRPPAHQRASGALHIAVKRRGGATVLDTLRQEGCLKARFPRMAPGAPAELVTLNSSGGVAGGDRLSSRFVAGPGTHAVVASQAAERFYRALPGSRAEVRTQIEVAAGATLEWLPQETILFDRSALRRHLEITLDATACFLGVESLVFGRAAMGEVVGQGELDDLIDLRRGGRCLLHDRIRLSGPVAERLGRRAIGAGATAVATVVLVRPDVEQRLAALRAALAPFEAGASCWDGMLVARIVAENGACLRRATVAALHVLRAGRPLPRVWLC